MIRTPPPLASRLLRACLSASALDIVAGDLDEEFARGRSAAWYWRQTVRSVAAHWLGLIPVAGEVLTSSIRQLGRQKLYVAGVAGTLALAVASAMASAVVVKRAFIDALPYPHADRLSVLMTEGFPSVSVHVLRELEQSAPPFEALAPMLSATLVLATADSTTSVNGMQVTRDYFDVVGARPVYGHVWSNPDERAVVVSWPFFERVLGADPNAVGRAITLDGIPRTVTGVMPRKYLAPYWPQHELWIPLDHAMLAKAPRARRQLTVLARRSASVDASTADAYLSAFSKRLQGQYPVEHGRQSWTARPLRDEMLTTSRQALIGVGSAAALLLLIVCVNIGGLATARAVGMQQQMAVRQALGGSRGRIFAEQLADALCVAATGTFAGLLLAPALVSIAARYQREFLDRVAAFQLDATVVAFGVGIGLLAGTLSALLPSRLIARTSLTGVARAARGATASRRLTVARQALVVAQVALALGLVVGAGLLVRTVRHLSDRPLGFRTDGMTTMQVTMPGGRFSQQTAQIQLEDNVLERLARIPGVTAVTASVGVPAHRAMGASLHIRGRSVAEGLTEVGYNSVAPGFMKMMGMPILSGRDISSDDRDGTQGAILLNETMARMYWPDGEAIGAEIFLGPGAPVPGEWMRVVGIVPDIQPYGPAERITPSAYGSTKQYSWPRRFFTVYTESAPENLEAEMRAAVRAADPAVSIGLLRSLNEMAEAPRGRHRLVMTVLVVFACVALTLCASGLYAVAAMMSGMRRREYAIRVALGAPREHVRWQVVRQSVTLAALGITAGLLVAAGGAKVLQGMLHGVATIDPMTFTSAAITLALISAAAAWWPARQAANIDPVETLRAE